MAPTGPASAIFGLTAVLVGAAAMLLWRVRETTRPVTLRKIVAPPLGMSTGLAMFLAPATRIPWTWATTAFMVGATLLAVPVSRSSRLVRRGDLVMLERSKAFLWVLLALVLVRIALRAYVGQFLSPPRTGAVFFLLAFGMIVRWRIGMLIAYRRIASVPP